MTNSTLAIVLRQGDTEEIYLTVTEPPVAPATSPTAMDLTGCTVLFVVKPNVAASDETGVTFSSAEADELVITNAVGGLATVKVPSSFTETVRTGWFCKVRVLSAGTAKTAGYGTLSIIDL